VRVETGSATERLGVELRRPRERLTVTVSSLAELAAWAWQSWAGRRLCRGGVAGVADLSPVVVSFSGFRPRVGGRRVSVLVQCAVMGGFAGS
jgi:hypothetical protein